MHFFSFSIRNFPYSFLVGPAFTASPTSVADGRLTTACSTISSSMKAFQGIKGYLNYPGKVTWKKKTSTKPREYVVSKASSRLSDLEKIWSKIQKKRKRSSENRICVYCDRALEEDEENGEDRDWTNCDKCKAEMHYDCIYRSR